MPTLFTRSVLFLSSYSPLFLIFAVHIWEKHPKSAYGLAAVALLSLAGLKLFLRIAQRVAPTSITVKAITSRDGDLMSYVVTYILPFIVVNLDSTSDLLSFGLLLVVVAVLYVNSNLIHVNPILNLLGFHVFEIEDQDEKGSILICKRKYLRKEQQLRVIPVGDYVSLEKD